MTIEELRDRKYTLAAKLTNLITDFEQENDIYVNEVIHTVEVYTPPNCNPVRAVQIKIEVKI